MSRSMLVFLANSSAAVARTVALVLASRATDVVVIAGDDLSIGRRETFDLPVLHVEDFTPVVGEAFERGSEVAHLRRDNQWREKQARAMFNARVRQERRKRKQMRGIGRR